MNSIELSVVVLTCNRPEQCRGLVASLVVLLNDVESEILVVNNGRPLGDFASGTDNVRVLQMPANMGISARNEGLRAACGDYILMLDDDVEIGAGIIKAVKHCFENYPEAGIVAFRVAGPDGREESCLLPVVFHGCACAFRRSVLEECGGYPDNFGYYVEEYDLAFRIFKKEYGVVFAESFGVVTHLREQKNRSLNRIIYFLVRNNACLCASHLPSSVIYSALKDVLIRYFVVARKERAVLGYIRGVLSVPAGLRRGLKQRNVLDQPLFNEISLLSSLRLACERMRAKFVDTVVVCGVGRFPSLWTDVLRQAGISDITFWDDNVCWKNRKIRGVPVLMPDQIDINSPGRTAFIVGLASTGDNRKWIKWLECKGLRQQIVTVGSSLVFIV